MHPPRIGLVMVAALALSACGTAPVATPTPLPVVPSCTPEFGGSPFPCTQAEFDAQQKLDARYAEAERVLRRNSELENQMYHERTGTVPPEAAALYDPEGPYMEHQAQVAQLAKSSRVAGSFQLSWVERTPVGNADAPGSLALVACIDGHDVTFVHDDGVVETGRSGAVKLVFTEREVPRIWTVYRVEVDRCAG